MIDGEIFAVQGKQYQRAYARPVDEWIVGVDLGQINDSTAIAAIHCTTTPRDSWTAHHPGPNQIGRLEQDTDCHFDVRLLERIPLGTPYPAQVQRVSEIMSKPPLRGSDLVVDSTGVGSAVTDLVSRCPAARPPAPGDH